MKKKGILLLGSLSLMVVAMVFIAVTLVSRANVTPESSDAATLKKKDLTSSSLSSKSTTNLPLKYTFQKLEMGGSDENITYSKDMNDLGYVVGTKYIWQGGYAYQVYPTMWDPKGNLITISDPHFKPNETNVSAINNSNVIIGDTEDHLNWKTTAYKYSISNGYQELPGYPQEKKLKNTKLFLPFSVNRLKSFRSLVSQDGNKTIYDPNEDVIGDFTSTFDINNDGDVVGESNLRGLLWVNEKTGYVDLSTIISQHYQNPYRVVPMVITDRVNNDVKISGFIYTIEDNNVKSVVFIMDYSVANSKEVSFKLIEDIGNAGGYPWTLPQQILSDESLLASYYFNDEYGNEKSDSFLVSPKGNYESSVRLSEYLRKAGLDIYNSDVYKMNDSKIGLGTYNTPSDLKNYHDFIYDFNTNQVQEIDKLVQEGAIVGYIPNTKFYPHHINKSGEILVSTNNLLKNKKFVGKLIPVK